MGKRRRGKQGVCGTAALGYGMGGGSDDVAQPRG